MGCSTQLNEMYGDIIARHKRTICRLKSALVKVCRQRDQWEQNAWHGLRRYQHVEADRGAARAEVNNMRQAQMLNDEQLTAWEPVVGAARLIAKEYTTGGPMFALPLVREIRALKDSETGEANAPAPTVPEQKGDAGAGAVAQFEPASGLLADGECQCCGKIAGDELNELLQCPACTVMLKEAARCPQCDELVVERDRLAERVRRLEWIHSEDLSRIADAEVRAEIAGKRAEAAEAERDKWKAHADRSDTELGAVADALPIPDWTPGDGTHADAVRKVVAQRDRLRAQQQGEVSPAHPLCNAIGCQKLKEEPQPAAVLESPCSGMEHDCEDCPMDDCRAKPQPSPSAEVPEPFYIVCEHNGPDCQFIETETEDGHGVGPAVAGEWSKHPLDDEFSRLGPYVLATTQPALLLARDGGDVPFLLDLQADLRDGKPMVMQRGDNDTEAYLRAHVGTLGPVAELMRRARSVCGACCGDAREHITGELRKALADPELRKLGEKEGGE